MCGITGIWAPVTPKDLERKLKAMCDALQHRGPDSGDCWLDAELGIGLGHRRLAIVELSELGAQPMHSHCGRYVLSYNGEIYNHAELRAELESGGKAPRWRGGSDTETMLACITVWGLEETLKRSVGMFAIALWDRKEQRLSLARDRFGEKPLYFGWVGEGGNAPFVFGSELKAMRAVPGFDNPVNRASVAGLLQYWAISAPDTIYQDMYQLLPGTFVEFSRKDVRNRSVSMKPYWQMADVALEGINNRFEDEASALEALNNALIQSVDGQMMADVPLGAFLSGGVDSSLIVALMQSVSDRPVKTFTISFDDREMNEAPFAAAVAKHLGTDHHELPVSAEDALEVVPRLATIYDEPFADPSQIPTYFVCRAARGQVTVALSGDAGDELFGGYNRYVAGTAMYRRFGKVPSFLRSAAASTLMAIPANAWNFSSKILPAKMNVSLIADKAQKLAFGLNNLDSVDEFYQSLLARWPNAIPPMIGGNDDVPSNLVQAVDEIDSPAETMMLMDAVGYLPNDILTKVDRAAMANSLETRVPFLDHRVAEIAWRLPLSLKVNNSQGKQALRKLLYRHVPRELIERPKAGFAIPLAGWLRGPLREWAEANLDRSRLAQEGFLDADQVQNLWHEHVRGRRDWSNRLWGILMFQSWLEAETSRVLPRAA